MARIRVGIEIDATPERVWQVVEPVERHIDWMHDAVAIRFTGEQTSGVGTEFLCDTKVGPLKLVDRMKLTEWVPAQAMGVRHTGMV
ncbi:MAG: SRPBCC family protein, partial [Actinomycetota bacterium]